MNAARLAVAALVALCATAFAADLPLNPAVTQIRRRHDLCSGLGEDAAAVRAIYGSA